jgi:hypothetical protein
MVRQIERKLYTEDLKETFAEDTVWSDKGKDRKM